MVYYHISPRTGNPNICRAEKRLCPLGPDTDHYSSREEAREAFALKNSGKTFKKFSRNSYNCNSDLLAPLFIAPKPLYFSEHEEDFLTEDSREFIVTVYNGDIPDHFPQSWDSGNGNNRFSLETNSMEQIITKHKVNDLGYYAVATKTFARTFAEIIKEDNPKNGGIVLDPLAGAGHLVKAFREAGIPSIASDNNSWKFSKDIEKLDALESIRKYGNDIDYVVISWAPYTENLDVKILELCRKDFPHIMILNIGEQEGGCTGSEEFWEKARVPKDWSRAGENNWNQRLFDSYETFISVHDFPLMVQ